MLAGVRAIETEWGSRDPGSGIRTETTETTREDGSMAPCRYLFAIRSRERRGQMVELERRENRPICVTFFCPSPE
jgi:hypothetical protein